MTDGLPHCVICFLTGKNADVDPNCALYWCRACLSYRQQQRQRVSGSGSALGAEDNACAGLRLHLQGQNGQLDPGRRHLWSSRHHLYHHPAYPQKGACKCSIFIFIFSSFVLLLLFYFIFSLFFPSSSSSFSRLRLFNCNLLCSTFGSRVLRTQKLRSPEIKITQRWRMFSL